MSIRLHCASCGTAFLTSDDSLGRRVGCPKCGAPQDVPTSVVAPSGPRPAPKTWVAPEEDDAEAETTFVPSRGRRRGWLVATAVALVVAGVGLAAGLTGWPYLRAWRNPPPKDPVERVALVYLEALAKGDQEAARSLGTVEEPPAIRSFERPRRDRQGSERIRGSFGPIAALHADIDRRFKFNPDLNRFEVRNPLGPAAETIDALHDAKAQMEQQKLAEKIAGGSPDDLFDAAEALASQIGQLAEGALAPQRLLPTYARLVEEAKPPLPPEAEALALDYGEHPATWDALLKRPFVTLRADGPFILDRAEVTAPVRDALASSGDPPSTLRLTLTRFRLEGIDTGWKVTGARRDPPPGAQPAPPSQADQPSHPPRPSRRPPARKSAVDHDSRGPT